MQSEIFDAYQSLGGRSLIVFGLLPNEHKMSLVNIKLKRTNNLNNLPIASKERLIFQCGFRRFSACPIFSQHTNSSKHKVCYHSLYLFIGYFNSASYYSVILMYNVHLNCSMYDFSNRKILSWRVCMHR